MTAKGTLIVMAKSPVAGQVKTRLTVKTHLTTAFTAAQAAALAQASLRDTLDTVVAAPAGRRLIAWDGERRSWLPNGVEVITQRGDGLDERLSNAFQTALSCPGHGPTLLVGMDTPQLRPADLSLDWGGADAVLGLCPDGGYWALGLSRFHPDVVRAFRCRRLKRANASWNACGHWGFEFGSCPPCAMSTPRPTPSP